ncbi:MAG TPA: hypothetical protein PL151_04855 [Phycisphaerae bacterium]|nr:hypothetical protein [Phycisphaerae bacterium]HOJ75704.1 hypothetical protein [Phycisphaerae bacterium]HOM53155.1 hypothetical protein [Phycisphaerae bacterium]HON67076.1 hypothetical protein [Phycisphaerae bacterium]HOQ87493.1 hypothetical protein [Phycisphaerae bacterium]
MAAPLASINTTARMIIAALATWLVPGAGHLLIGDRVRGIAFLVTITLTFWTGVAIGGVKNTVSPVDRTLWFAGQICAGGHSFAALAWASTIPSPYGTDTPAASVIGYGRAEEVSVVYTAIAGMLNILIILDVLVRAEKPLVPVPAKPPGGRPPRRT